MEKKRTCEIGILHDTLLMLDGGKLRVFKSEVPNFPFSVKFNLKSSFSGLTKLCRYFAMKPKLGIMQFYKTGSRPDDYLGIFFKEMI